MQVTLWPSNTERGKWIGSDISGDQLQVCHKVVLLRVKGCIWIGSTGMGWSVFYFLPIEIDYVSNFLSGFPRSLSLRTVLNHKNTKRVSTRGDFNKELTFAGREGNSRGRQTQRGHPPSPPPCSG